MRLAALGTIGGWASVAAVQTTWTPALPLALLVASSFSLVWAAHIVTYAVRSLTARRVRASLESSSERDDLMTRRVALETLVRASVVALLVPVFGSRLLRPRNALAQVGPCKGQVTVHTRPNGRIEVEAIECGPPCASGAPCTATTVFDDFENRETSPFDEFCQCDDAVGEPADCHLVVRTEKKVQGKKLVSTQRFVKCRGACGGGLNCVCFSTQAETPPGFPRGTTSRTYKCVCQEGAGEKCPIGTQESKKETEDREKRERREKKRKEDEEDEEKKKKEDEEKKEKPDK
jgi:hypothetical protein